MRQLLLCQLRPDIFVKGGGYQREDLPEADVVEQSGGRVHLFPYLDGPSTTGIIERIHRLTPRPSPVTAC